MKKRSAFTVIAIVCSTFFFSQCSDNKTGETNYQKDTSLVGGKVNNGYESQIPGRESANFEGGYFYPGDIGRLLDDGLLAIEGRINDTINVGGWKVNAVDLEARLAFLPGVDDLCVCVMPLAEGDLLTIAVVTRDTVDLNAVAQRIRAELPTGRAFHLVRIRSIPRNEMGKIPRAMIANKLTALYGATRENLGKNSANA